MIVFAKKNSWTEYEYWGYIVGFNEIGEAVWYKLIYCDDCDVGPLPEGKENYPHIVTPRTGNMVNYVLTDDECSLITGLHPVAARDKLMDMLADELITPDIDPAAAAG